MAFWPTSKGRGELFPIPRRRFADEIRSGGGGLRSGRWARLSTKESIGTGWVERGSLELSSGGEVFSGGGDDDNSLDKRSSVMKVLM
jgi:hypothetical protein